MRRHLRLVTDPGPGAELVPLPRDTCPCCGGPTTTLVVASMDALFRHGGYGASRLTRHRSCPRCNWWLEIEVSEVRPRP